jgi:sec-independent protein translocase protein TatA
MRLGSLGPVELILIVMAIVLVFGASKLGDIGGALGKSIREFKKESNIPEPEKNEAAEARASSAPAAPTAEATKTPVGAGDFRPPADSTS